MATTGATGSNGYATAVPATNDQVTEQCYQWLNTESGVNANFTLVATTSMRLNEHYYNYGGTVQSSATTPFSGATGVGVGTKVSPNYRPTTCTTGVAYWATDEGEWDSTNGATPDGQLYTCTATNTWTLSYTPYTYPHPLTAGDDATPPVPGDSGTLAASSESYTTLTLDWTEADDAVTAQSSLQYEVRRSLSNNIGTVANAEANGTIAQAYTADIDTANITGLSPATTYYFTVIVKDAAGNREVYDTVSATTLTDSTAPTPGNSGTITTASVSTASLTLNWTAATDAVTAQASLQYEVCRSTSNNVSDVTNCELRTIIQSFTANIVTLPVTALTCGTNYYFNVVVRDASLNKQAYTAKSQATSACPTTGKAGKLKGRGGR
jgi:hypothetical protein